MLHVRAAEELRGPLGLMLYKREKVQGFESYASGQSAVNINRSGREAFSADMGAPWRSQAEEALEMEHWNTCLLPVATVGKVVTPGVSCGNLEHDNQWEKMKGRG